MMNNIGPLIFSLFQKLNMEQYKKLPKLKTLAVHDVQINIMHSLLQYKRKLV